MSDLAAWSYTAKATVWPLIGREDWSGALTFGPPAVFACDYSAKAERMTDAKGVEFTTRQTIYTEKADIKQGDFVLIGASSLADPIAAGAVEVRAITRDADTFSRAKDDYKILS